MVAVFQSLDPDSNWTEQTLSTALGDTKASKGCGGFDYEDGRLGWPRTAWPYCAFSTPL